MKQKPILFDSESVRALLTCAKCEERSVPFPCEHCGSTEFRKTQTRRICNPQLPDDWEPFGEIRMLHKMKDDEFVTDSFGHPIEIGLGWCNQDGDLGYKPKYYEGELGWAKETYWIAEVEGMGHTPCMVYAAAWDGPGEPTLAHLCDHAPMPPENFYDPPIKYGKHSSRFMPKWATRLWVEFGPSRPPERVGTISWDDACAEGWPGPHTDCTEYEGAVEWFKFRWNGIYGKDAWEKNQWAWPYQFKRIGEPK
ncbi:MAG TPA: hypothetical protein VFI02_11235 [Armatimonadota bacterium]|nr:hypothetical protein [Armatimonadota bacterium]